MLTAIAGINWGDEGKGRMVDLLSAGYDIVARYQGGNNAGHTVVNEKGKFILNLLPSGILRETTVNVMGNGMVIDLEHLAGELEALRARGIAVTPDNLKISDKAVICLPCTGCLTGWKRTGSAQRSRARPGAASPRRIPDKYMRKALRMGDLLDPQALRAAAETFVGWKNLLIAGRLRRRGPHTGGNARLARALRRAAASVYLRPVAVSDRGHCGGQNVLFEAQLGALRDIDFGIYPYSSSSSTIAAYAPIGAGVPGARLDKVIGIMKAYSSSVGGGPFTCELFGEAGEQLRAPAGNTARPPGGPAASAGLTRSPRATACWCRGPRSWP